MLAAAAVTYYYSPAACDYFGQKKEDTYILSPALAGMCQFASCSEVPTTLAVVEQMPLRVVVTGMAREMIR